MYDNSFLPLVLISFNLFWAKLERSGKNFFNLLWIFIVMHASIFFNSSLVSPLSLSLSVLFWKEEGNNTILTFETIV